MNQTGCNICGLKTNNKAGGVGKIEEEVKVEREVREREETVAKIEDHVGSLSKHVLPIYYTAVWNVCICLQEQ